MKSAYDLVEPYVAATGPGTPTTKEYSVFMFFFILDFIKCIVISIPMTIVWLLGFIFPKKSKSIKGEVAVVTGGGNGMGRGLCLRLAEEGCHIAVVDIDFHAAEETAQLINSSKNAKACAYQANVSKVDEIEQLKKDVLNEFGRVDILVNNAGLLARYSLREGTAEDIQNVIDVNLTSHFWLIRAFLPGMIENRHGHIVGMSSLSGIMGLGRGISYCATKHGIKGLMSALEEELRMDNQNFIKLTTVLPWFIATRKVMEENFKMRVPLLSVEYASDVIVDGILKNVSVMSVPRKDLPFSQIMSNFPVDVQRLFREKWYTCEILKKHVLQDGDA